MRKKKFFDNLGNITMNGLFVTVLCFVIYGFGTIALVNMNINMFNFYDER